MVEDSITRPVECVAFPEENPGDFLQLFSIASFQRLQQWVPPATKNPSRELWEELGLERGSEELPTIRYLKYKQL